MVKTILRIEGLCFFVASLHFYFLLNGNWLILGLLLFASDISMIGYLRSKRLGAITYNLLHNYALGIIVVLVGLVIHDNLIVLIGLILTAHVGMDRMFGFGLKYPSSFKDTHLQKI